MIELRPYQRHALDVLAGYFGLVSEYAANPSASVAARAAELAYEDVTEGEIGRRVPYRDVSEAAATGGGGPALADLRGLPYVCVRIPTGGGKTLVAAYTPAVVFERLLGTDRGVVLWLVPSGAILSQTLTALQDRAHPYRQALAARLGAVTVVDVTGALQLAEADLDGSTVVIVATLQSFRRDDTAGLRVFAENADFLRAVERIPTTPPGADGTAADGFDRYADGRPVPSLANVLRSRRPLVIMDEAHNARTPLSFETLGRLAPSCIVEFTATPDHAVTPSNVVVQASASELKAAHMIRLPISLTVRPQWQAVVDDALALRSRLEELARAEERATGRYLRPILLVQAEARHKGRETVHVGAIRDYLREAGVPDAWVRTATGTEWELGDEDLLSPMSGVRVLVTVQALREGWDCPFAYVLATVSNVSSPTAVEQVVGRVLRMPGARPFDESALNRAYVFASSADFNRTFNGIVGALRESGFEREEAAALVRAGLPPVRQGRLDDRTDGSPGGLFDTVDPMDAVATVDVPLAAADVPEALPPGATYDALRGALRLPVAVARESFAELVEVLPSRSSAVLRAAVEPRATPFERRVPLVVPLLGVRTGNLFEPFDASHVAEAAAGSWSLLNTPPELPGYTPAAGIVRHFALDVTDAGKMLTGADSFVARMQAQAELFTRDLSWNAKKLALWLDQRLIAPDVRQSDRAAFVAGIVHRLEAEHGLEALIRDRARLAQALAGRVVALRAAARERAFQTFLDGMGPGDLTVSLEDPSVAFSFLTERVSPRLYDGPHQFRRHYYPHVGAFDSNEERDCAVFLDGWERVDTWVRNPVRYGFSLPTATGRFYPDFVCRLTDGRALVVEYKGQHLYDVPEERAKRTVGDLWAERSGGVCLFKMPHPSRVVDDLHLVVGA